MMRKNLIYAVLAVFLIVFGYNPMFAQDAKDKYDAINNYMETAVEDTTKEIIILKEKINPNETIIYI